MLSSEDSRVLEILWRLVKTIAAAARLIVVRNELLRSLCDANLSGDKDS